MTESNTYLDTCHDLGILEVLLAQRGGVVHHRVAFAVGFIHCCGGEKGLV